MTPHDEIERMDECRYCGLHMATKDGKYHSNRHCPAHMGTCEPKPKMTDTKDEIKPCPFCGGITLAISDDAPQAYIQCACGMNFNRRQNDDEYMLCVNDSFGHMVKAWNTRATDTTLHELSERLKVAEAALREISTMRNKDGQKVDFPQYIAEQALQRITAPLDGVGG